MPISWLIVAVILGHRPGLAGVEIRYHLWRSLVGTADAGIRIDWVGRSFGGGLGRRLSGSFGRGLRGSFRRPGSPDLVAAYIPVISLTNLVARELTEFIVVPVLCLVLAPIKDIGEVGTSLLVGLHVGSCDIGTFVARGDAVAPISAIAAACLLFALAPATVLLATFEAALAGVDRRHADGERCEGEGYGGLGELHGWCAWGDFGPWFVGVMPTFSSRNSLWNEASIGERGQSSNFGEGTTCA